MGPLDTSPNFSYHSRRSGRAAPRMHRRNRDRSQAFKAHGSLFRYRCHRHLAGHESDLAEVKVLWAAAQADLEALSAPELQEVSSARSRGWGRARVGFFGLGLGLGLGLGPGLG